MFKSNWSSWYQQVFTGLNRTQRFLLPPAGSMRFQLIPKRSECFQLVLACFIWCQQASTCSSRFWLVPNRSCWPRWVKVPAGTIRFLNRFLLKGFYWFQLVPTGWYCLCPGYCLLQLWCQRGIRRRWRYSRRSRSPGVWSQICRLYTLIREANTSSAWQNKERMRMHLR